MASDGGENAAHPDPRTRGTAMLFQMLVNEREESEEALQGLEELSQQTGTHELLRLHELFVLLATMLAQPGIESLSVA